MAQFDLFDPQLAPKGVATLLKTPLLENDRVDFGVLCPPSRARRGGWDLSCDSGYALAVKHGH